MKPMPRQITPDMNPQMPLQITISKTADGQFDYMQIVAADQFSLNIVLISKSIMITDARVENRE